LFHTNLCKSQNKKDPEKKILEVARIAGDAAGRKAGEVAGQKAGEEAGRAAGKIEGIKAANAVVRAAEKQSKPEAGKNVNAAPVRGSKRGTAGGKAVSKSKSNSGCPSTRHNYL